MPGVVGVPDSSKVVVLTVPGELSPEKLVPGGIEPETVHDTGGVWVPFTV